MRILASLICLLVTVGGVRAQDDRPLVEQWREVIQYGIDSEVVELLPRISAQGEWRLDAALSERLTETRSAELREKLLAYFTEHEREAGVAAAREMILSYDEPAPAVLQAAIVYLTEVEAALDSALLDRYVDIANGRAYLPAAAAVRAIGTLGGEDAAPRLMELYERASRTELRGAVVRAIGETGDERAVEMLTRLAEDTTEEPSIRQYAAYSLGEIGAAESMSTLSGLLSDENAIVRAYAVSALGNYREQAATDLLSASLRDSYWRVRVAALDGLKRTAELAAEAGESFPADAVPAVAYKARRDPERPVRLAAIGALGAIGDAESISALIELFEGELQPLEIRSAAGQELISKHLDVARDAIDRVLSAEWETESSRVLDFTAKMLAETEDGGLTQLFERLLSHPNYVIRIYGIRGIATNSLGGYADRLREIAGEASGALRSAARAALERMGEPLPEPEATESTDP